jgi:aminopeptidase-like protein
MFDLFRREFRREFSGQAAKRNVEGVTQFHRPSWVTPGLREAAEWCLQQWQRDGLRVQKDDFPADGRTLFFSCISPLEWDCEEAELWIWEPVEHRQRLCSTHDHLFHIVTYSAPTPPDGVVAEVVRVEQTDEEAAYEGFDVRGKVVLTSTPLDRAKLFAVERHGAVGLIADCANLDSVPLVPNRKRGDLQDALEWQFFEGIDEQVWGFVLSPRMGDSLARVIREVTTRGERLKVKALVKARFYEGSFSNVHALIPGTGELDQEVVIVTNYCHPRGMANNSASAVGTMLEMSRALKRLIDTGAIPRPRRDIRFLLVPELTGSYAHLARYEHEIPRVVAGINLAMIGGNLETTGGLHLYEDAHRSVPSFAGDLLRRIIEEDAIEYASFGGAFHYSPYRHLETPFFGLGDGPLLSDPTINIPSPVFYQWPYKNYHTTMDTLEYIDPDVLTKNAAIAASYLYFIASSSTSDALWLCDEMESNFVRDIKDQSQRVGSLLRSKEEMRPYLVERYPRRLQFELDRRLADFSAVLRLCGPQEQEVVQSRLAEITQYLTAFVHNEESRFVKRVREVYPEAMDADVSVGDDNELVRRARASVPRRIYRSRVDERHVSDKLNRLGTEVKIAYRAFLERRSPQWATRSLARQVVNWMDGRRTLFDICETLELDTGIRDLGFVVDYADWLVRLGFIELGTSVTRPRQGGPRTTKPQRSSAFPGGEMR